MKKRIKKVIKKYVKFLMVKVIQLIHLIFNMIYKLDDKQVLFLSDVREVLGGNLKEMYDYLEGKDYKRILCLKKERRVRRSFKEKIHLIKLLSTSKYVLLDDYSMSISMMIVRKGQEVVQLWHGPGAFKTMGYSRHDKAFSFLDKYNGHMNYTKSIVTADGVRWCFAEAFGISKDNVHAAGFPRTDCFFDKKYIEKTRKEFFKKYPELKNKKIILFAPTYRGENLKVANYDFSTLDIDDIYKSLHKDYVFLFKLHPALYNNIDKGIVTMPDLSDYKDFYYDFSSYRDINDLLMITDVLITDYSSVIFDYALLNKPVVYFTYDLELYENDRGLYYEFKDYVYGSVSKNSKELVKAIKDGKMMNDKRKAFMKKFMEACDGKSTEKTFKLIFEGNKKEK
ncbi:MAG: hypothetical protein E7162_04985 [Firmicutes bacterium]|nr:hypothetical protein [Bacillota bacterium]